MGIRFIFLLLALAAIWLIIRFYWKTGRTIQQSKKPKLKSDNMVACHYCGLHIPSGEAIKVENHFFCCEEHRQLGNNQQHDQSKH